MLKITIPGFKNLQLEHLILDYNGTLACDGQLLTSVQERIATLSNKLQIHVITADTLGNVRSALSDVPCELFILPPDNQDVGKLNYIDKLRAATTVCIGNGRNDSMMLKESALGIAVLQDEGVATETLIAADVVAPTILAAFDLLLIPQRLVATLRT